MLLAWSDNSSAFGPSQGRLRIDVAYLTSSAVSGEMSGGMAMYRGGAQLAFERNASRAYAIPYFAADIGGLWSDATGRRWYVDGGVACATCHHEHNGVRAGEPPGAPNWHLPPADTPMVFQGRSPRQLCEQLKDPRQTGHRDLARLIDHVAHDELVAWGWAPGPGRAPVPVPRADVVAAMQRWADAGAPCPADAP